jgi:hypothetical protein
MTQAENIINLFKISGLSETEWIELDNLDEARLAYDKNKQVVVENEHGSFFPVEDLSREEMEIFLFVIPVVSEIDTLRAKLISTKIKMEEVLAERASILEEAVSFINKESDKQKRDELFNQIFDFQGSLLFRAGYEMRKRTE